MGPVASGGNLRQLLKTAIYRVFFLIKSRISILMFVYQVYVYTTKMAVEWDDDGKCLSSNQDLYPADSDDGFHDISYAVDDD